MPIIRTFLPIVAGMAEMTHRRFTFFNIVGALIWCGGITLAGFFLGDVIPNIDEYILPHYYCNHCHFIITPAHPIFTHEEQEIVVDTYVKKLWLNIMTMG